MCYWDQDQFQQQVEDVVEKCCCGLVGKVWCGRQGGCGGLCYVVDLFIGLMLVQFVYVMYDDLVVDLDYGCSVNDCQQFYEVWYYLYDFVFQFGQWVVVFCQMQVKIICFYDQCYKVIDCYCDVYGDYGKDQCFLLDCVVGGDGGQCDSYDFC